MRIRLEIRDKSFNIINILDNEYLNLNWSYSRIGGCGEFSFLLPRKIFEERAITGEYNVRIYYRNPSTGAYDLRYQGIIENKAPSVRGNSETIGFSGHGYISQLSRVYVNTTYTSTEVSVIVKNILDTYVTPNTNISYNVSDLEATTFTPSSIEFNTNALSAIQTLADLVGIREWGVDKNRNFFFKARSLIPQIFFPIGHKITGYSENLDFKEIKNRVYVQGAQVGGTYFFFGPYNDIGSQAKYNRRDYVTQNSSITVSAVAQQFATSIIEEFKEVSVKANFSLINYESELEATIPIPIINILIKQDKYGEKKFGEGLYSGLVNFHTNRINYTLSNNNSLKVDVDLGKPRPTLSEEISQIKYELEQSRNASL